MSKTLCSEDFMTRRLWKRDHLYTECASLYYVNIISRNKLLHLSLVHMKIKVLRVGRLVEFVEDSLPTYEHTPCVAD